MQNRETQLNSNDFQRRISLACIVFCSIIFLIHGVLRLVPGGLTKFFKPIFILVCLLPAGAGFYKLRSTKWMIVLLAYFSVILVANELTSTAIEMYVSILLFGIFVVLASCRAWTEREIRLIFMTFIIACATQSALVLWSNPGLLHSGGNQHISFLGQTINRNPVAFAVSPGALCSLTVFLYRGRRGKRGVVLLCLMSFLLTAFTVFAIGCRSAFYALAAGCMLIVWGKTKNMGASKRFIARIGIIFFVLLIVAVSINMTADTYSSRLFDFGGEDYDSGRGDIWEVAWSGIKEKPIFGGGFDYWGEVGGEMGTHNTFLLYMLFGGYIAGALLAIFLLAAAIQALKTKQLLPLAFLMETICHCYTETDFDYYASMPIILVFILVNYLNSHNGDAKQLF